MMPLVLRAKLCLAGLFVGVAIAGLIARWFFGINL